jgi:hypothetical protein
VWLWLEAVQDDFGRHWPDGHYVWAAGRLGAFNGTYLAARPLPPYPWLGDAYLAQRIRRTDVDGGLPLFEDRTTWQHHLFRSVFPSQTGERLQHLWGRRHATIRALAQLPSGLRHGDAHRSNLLISRPRSGSQREQTLTAIDWGNIGSGPPGADLADLVLGWLSGGQEASSPAAGTPEGAERLYAAYAAGLAEGGWRGDPAVVRLGYAGTLSLIGASRLHWTLGRVLGDALGDALGDVHRGSREGPAAASRAGLLARWGVLTRYVLQLGRETAHFLGAQ